MKILSNYYYEWPLMQVMGNRHEPERVDNAIAQAGEIDRDYDMWVTLISYMIRIARQEMVRN